MTPTPPVHPVLPPMSASASPPHNALRILVYLEWILLGIAAIASLSPFPITLRAGRLRALPPGFIRLEVLDFPIVISLGALLCILALGLLRPYRLFPAVSRISRSKVYSPTSTGRSAAPFLPYVLHTAAGFGLSWLAILLGGKGSSVFPPLLLIVVMRSCLFFPWRDRLLVALTAFGSFVLMQGLSLMQLKPLGVPLNRLPMQPGRHGSARQLPPQEWLEGVVLNAALNTSLLFGLVLAFVLLLVGALLAEQESRDRLTQVNQQLRRYALLAEDQATLQERNRIAREIHDSVGHCLTAQSIQLENVAMLLHRDLDQAEARLLQARRLGREALQNVRQSVATLRSHPLQGKSLEAAIEELLQEFQRHTQIKTEVSMQLARQPAPEVNIAIYRVIQEALTNITKHSQAGAIALRLHQHGVGLHLQLSDNGKGFDPSQNTTGFGLQGMQERILAVGGTFQIESESGKGSTITLFIPVIPTDFKAVSG